MYESLNSQILLQLHTYHFQPTLIMKRDNIVQSYSKLWMLKRYVYSLHCQMCMCYIQPFSCCIWAFHCSLKRWSYDDPLHSLSNVRLNLFINLHAYWKLRSCSIWTRDVHILGDAFIPDAALHAPWFAGVYYMYILCTLYISWSLHTCCTNHWKVSLCCWTRSANWAHPCLAQDVFEWFVDAQYSVWCLVSLLV